MLIEEVDGFDLQTPKGVFSDNFDVLGTTIEASLCAALAVKLETELRRDDDLSFERCESFSNQFFVCERPIDFGRVEESHAKLDRPPRSEIISRLSLGDP